MTMNRFSDTFKPAGVVKFLPLFDAAAGGVPRPVYPDPSDPASNAAAVAANVQVWRGKVTKADGVVEYVDGATVTLLDDPTALNGGLGCRAGDAFWLSTDGRFMVAQHSAARVGSAWPVKCLIAEGVMTSQSVAPDGSIVAASSGGTGPQGPKGDKGDKGDRGDPGPAGGGLVYGVDSSASPYNVGAGVDDWLGLQTLVDSLDATKPHLILLPPGDLHFRRPVTIKNNGIRFVGGGKGVTNVFAPGFDAFAVGPFDASRSGGTYSYGDTSRPDLHGVMDATLAPTSGVAWGFDSKGRNYALDGNTGLSFGGRSASPSWVWDYWDADGFTLEIAFAGGAEQGTTFCGIGPYQSEPSPFWLVRPTGTDTLQFTCCVQGDPVGTVRKLNMTGVDFSLPVVRARFWFDHAAGTCGGWAGGSDRATSWESGFVFAPGTRFRPNDRGRPFQVGNGSAGTQHAFKVYGLCLSNVAVAADAGTDAARYLKRTAGVVGFLDVTKKETGRLLNFASGPAATGNDGFGFVHDNIDYGSFVGGSEFAGFTVMGGGVSLSGANKARVTSVESNGGRFGFSCQHTVANWTIVFRDCDFSGDVAGVNLYELIGTFDHPTISRGGIASLILTSCSTTWERAEFTGFGVAQARCVDVIGGSYANDNVFLWPLIDAEFTAFSSDVFRASNSANCATRLTVVGSAAGGLDPAGAGYVFRLDGQPGFSFPAVLDVRAFGLPPCAGAALVSGATVGEWVGVIDMRQAGSLPGPTGPAHDPAKLTTLT